jgi:hypothetical protein
MTPTSIKQPAFKMWPMLSPTQGAPTGASPVIFTKWNTLLASKLKPLSLAASQDIDEETQALIREWEQENHSLQSSLLEAVIATWDENQRRQIVQIHQVLVTRLMNKISALSLPNSTSGPSVFDALNNLLGETLNFMEELMGRYFDRNEKVPTHHFQIAQNTLKSQLKNLEGAVMQQDNMDLFLKETLRKRLNAVLNDGHHVLTYAEISCFTELLSELLSVVQFGSTDNIRELLYYLNYNEETFIAYEYQRLRQLITHLESPKHKAAVLRLEQKKINQWPVKLSCFFSSIMPSLREQVNGWIDEEVKFFESGYSSQVAENGNVESDNKIQTSLSVAKLAVIIRLLVIDKIIINRTIAPMLRIAAKVFTTLQRDEISFVSLEAKYHAPEKATVSAVRDMLFKWIKILDKL